MVTRRRSGLNFARSRGQGCPTRRPKPRTKQPPGLPRAWNRATAAARFTAPAHLHPPLTVGATLDRVSRRELPGRSPVRPSPRATPGRVGGTGALPDEAGRDTSRARVRSIRQL